MICFGRVCGDDGVIDFGTVGEPFLKADRSAFWWDDAGCTAFGVVLLGSRSTCVGGCGAWGVEGIALGFVGDISSAF